MKVVLAAAGIACAAAVFVPQANADPSPGHGTIVFAQSPQMTCQIGSDDLDEPGGGASVVCQSSDRLGFPQSPTAPAEQSGGSSMHLHQVVVTYAGKLSYRDANIGMGGDGDAPPALANGNTYHIQGWTVVPTTEGITFTHDATRHGMTIDGMDKVIPF